MACDTTLNRARRSMDEVSRDAEDPRVSQMIYPLMQALDIAYLGVDVAMGGIDQRKIHMLAREELPALGFKSPICLHTPILLGLDGTKMSSSKGNNISVDDPAEVVAKKIEKAFCPAGQVADNPVLDLFRFHIFIKYPTITIERPEKFGGNLEYDELRGAAGRFRGEEGPSRRPEEDRRQVHEPDPGVGQETDVKVRKHTLSYIT